VKEKRPYKHAGQWATIFRDVLGVSYREAREMFRTLADNGEFIARRNGVWGITYKMRDER